MIEEKCIGICPSCLAAFKDCLYLPYNLNMLKKPFSYCINYFSQRRSIKEPEESEQAEVSRENQIYGEIIVTNNYSNYYSEKKISFFIKITSFSYTLNFIITISSQNTFSQFYPTLCNHLTCCCPLSSLLIHPSYSFQADPKITLISYSRGKLLYMHHTKFKSSGWLSKFLTFYSTQHFRVCFLLFPEMLFPIVLLKTVSLMWFPVSNEMTSNAVEKHSGSSPQLGI